MSVLETWIANARAAHKRLVMPEGMDARVVAAANKVIAEKVAEVTVLGTEEEIAAACQKAGITERLFKQIDYINSPMMADYVAKYKELRDQKAAKAGKPLMSIEEAQSKMKSRIFFGAMMAREGLVDGLVAGSIASTADMLRAAFQVIGTAKGIKSASSCFIMDLATPAPNGENVLLFADCAVNPNPDAAMLVDIAAATCKTYRALLGKQPKVAFISFSSFGSADNELLVKVREAAKLFHEKVQAENLDILCEPQEVQFDAATVPQVASMKCKGTEINGGANVLIFPDLNAGNIGYKIAQRLGHANAFGPALQGLAMPLNDLSRGCSADDIFGTAALTVNQAIANEQKA